ncbi:hypothetical protein [Nonomuraea angiospora]
MAQGLARRAHVLGEAWIDSRRVFTQENGKVISEILGHARESFTSEVYVSVAEELQEEAAQAIAAFVPRKSRI